MTEIERIGLTIRELRRKQGMTMKELGQKVGLSESMIWRYEKGDLKALNMELVKKIAKVLEVAPEVLLGWAESEKPLPENVFLPPETRKIPMLGEIACGTPKYAAQEFEYVDGPVKADFCLTARGDSMINARIYDGDIVFCHAQDSVENGEIAAVIIDDEATLKRFYKIENTVMLKPENAKYKDLVYTGEQINNIRIIGKAISAQIKVR
jgi:repressor LexA